MNKEIKDIIDPNILPIIEKLNKKGLRTKYCCAGIGKSYCKGYGWKNSHKFNSYPYILFSTAADKSQINQLINLIVLKNGMMKGKSEYSMPHISQNRFNKRTDFSNVPFSFKVEAKPPYPFFDVIVKSVIPVKLVKLMGQTRIYNLNGNSAFKDIPALMNDLKVQNYELSIHFGQLLGLSLKQDAYRYKKQWLKVVNEFADQL